MTIKPENIGESRFIFFSRGKLSGAAGAKEKQIQEEIAKEKPEKKDKPDDIIDETEANAKFDAIEEKIKGSPITGKHKETIRGKLGELVDTWKGKIDAVGKKAADKLKAVWKKTNEALAKFNERKDVVEIYQTLESLYDKQGKPKAGVGKAINLVTYRKGSGEWEKINENLVAAGFPEEKIKPLQRMLGVNANGEVGPETINAMSSMLGLTIRVEFADETKYAGEEKSEEQKAAEAKGVSDEGDLNYTPGEGEKQSFEPELVDGEAAPKIEPNAPNWVEVDSEGNPSNPPEVQEEKSAEKPEGKEFSKEALEAMKIPLSFTFLNKTLKLSKVALTRYFVAYENCDINKAIPIGQIWKKLDDISNRYLKGLDAKTTQAALVHAFGKLVNGYDEKLVPDQILLLNVVKVGEKVKGIVEKRSDKEVLLSAQLEVRDAEVKHLGKLVKENPNFAQFWKDSNEPQIEKTLKALERHNADIAKLEGGIASLNGEIKALTTSSFVSQYQYLLNGGKDTRAVLLRMHDSFGDDVPDFIKPKIKEVLGGIQEDPNASEFHKLFYAGKYEEALRLLAKENDDRNKVPGIQGHMGLHDYVAAYRKYKDNPKIAKLARMFKANGSYAGKKIEEGYLPIPINRREDRRGRVKYQILLVRENPDGSLNHLCVQDNGDQIGAYPDAPPIVQNFGAEHVITAEKMQEMENSDKAMKEKISMVIGKSPSFKAVRNAGAILNRQLGPMQSLFQSGMQGNKTEGFVNMLKVEAGKLRGSKAIGQLRGNLAQARKELSALRSFSDAGMKDQFEKQIAQLEKQLSSITRIVEGSKINSICDRILDKDFDVDDFGRWALKTGLPWLVTIVAATAAVVITLSTFGAGTPAGLALVAAVGVKGVGLATAATAAFVGTAAGMAANELVSAGTHVAGQAIYGDEFSNKTMLGKYITDEKVYNPKTDKYEKLEGSTVAKVYGKQFAMGFVTTFAMVGLGQLAGTYLAKFAAANLESASVAKSAAARLLQKIPRLGPQTVDVMKQHGLESMTRKVFKEALEELGEEGAQTVGERIDPKLGFLVSMYSCLNGGSMEYKLGEYDVVAEGSSAKGNRAETAWSYDASKTQEFIAKLEGEYGKKGFDVETSPDGTILVDAKIALKDGTILTNKMTFKPTTESMTMRKTITEGMDKEGKSTAERLYGVKRVSGDNYEYSQTTPEGKIGIAEYLGRRGFVINGDPESGEFEAVKGEEVVKFRASGKVEGEAEVAEAKPVGAAAGVAAGIESESEGEPAEVQPAVDGEPGAHTESEGEAESEAEAEAEVEVEAEEAEAAPAEAVAEAEVAPEAEAGPVEAVVEGKAAPVEAMTEVETEAKAKAQAETKAKLREYLQETYSDQDPGTLESIMDKYESAIDFVADPETRAGIDTVFEGLNLSPEAEQALRTHIEQHALQQHFDNPEQYVSHGFDHSLNVKTHIEKIMTDNPKIIESMQEKYGISEAESAAMVKLVAIYHDFGYPEIGELGKALHGLTGAEIAATPEFLAIMKGVITTEGADFNLLMHDFKTAILFHSADKVEMTREAKVRIGHGYFLMDSGNIVEVYNYYQEKGHTERPKVVCTKKVEAKMKRELWNAGLSPKDFDFVRPDDPGSLTPEGLFKGRNVDFAGGKGEKEGGLVLGIEYKETTLEQYPLNFSIRLADNLDMTMERFSPIQRTEAFREIYHRLGPVEGRIPPTGLLLSELETSRKKGEPTLAEILSNPNYADIFATLELDVSADSNIRDLIQDYKMKIMGEVLSKPEYEAEVSKFPEAKFSSLVKHVNTQSIRHFGGCESVTKVSFTPGGELILTVDQAKFEEMNKTTVSEKAVDIRGNKYGVEVGLGEYQIWRAYEAFRSLKQGDGQNIRIRVQNEAGQSVIGSEGFSGYFAAKQPPRATTAEPAKPPKKPLTREPRVRSPKSQGRAKRKARRKAQRKARRKTRRAA